MGVNTPLGLEIEGEESLLGNYTAETFEIDSVNMEKYGEIHGCNRGSKTPFEPCG